MFSKIAFTSAAIIATSANAAVARVECRYDSDIYDGTLEAFAKFFQHNDGTITYTGIFKGAVPQQDYTWSLFDTEPVAATSADDGQFVFALHTNNNGNACVSRLIMNSYDLADVTNKYIGISNEAKAIVAYCQLLPPV